MKWLFYITVMLNIVYFAYNLSYKDSLIIPESSLSQSSDKSIVLLEELNNNDSNFNQAIQSGQKKSIESTEVSQNNNTAIDQDLDKTAEIEQKSVLPAQKNTAYIISIEILDKPVSTDLQEQESENQGSNHSKVLNHQLSPERLSKLNRQQPLILHKTRIKPEKMTSKLLPTALCWGHLKSRNWILSSWSWNNCMPIAYHLGLKLPPR